MPQLLFDNLTNLGVTISGSRRVLLFLDFDGTLAPIGDVPALANMPANTRTMLEHLANEEKYCVVIISGRALADLQPRVGLTDLIYAGNHGLEISGPGLRFVEPQAAQRIQALGEVYRHLRTSLHHIPGVEIENKVLTASVHYRRTPKNFRDQVHEIVHTAVESNLFRVAHGLEVLEVRPRVDWHKGMAVRWIQETTGLPDALPVYLGDDLTDEDAFTALPKGVTVSVGRPVETSAQYYMEKQRHVPEFLAWLAGLGSVMN